MLSLLNLELAPPAAEATDWLSRLGELAAGLHPLLAALAFAFVLAAVWLELWICLARREDWIAAQRMATKAAAWLMVLAVASGWRFAVGDFEPDVVALYRIFGWISAGGAVLCAFWTPRWPESERAGFRWGLTLTTMAVLLAAHLALYLLFGPELFLPGSARVSA